MIQAQITITEVKEVAGFIHQNSIYSGNSNRYKNKRSLTSVSYEPKALFVRAILNGEWVSFYTPTVIVRNTTGFLNYSSMDENAWFQLTEESPIGVHGAKMFDGGSGMNVAIVSKCTIQPKIQVGDVITIGYVEINGRMKRVKVIK